MYTYPRPPYSSRRIYHSLTFVHLNQFNMLVSYTYRADDAGATENLSPTKKDAGGEGTTKTFSFFLLVTLGTIGPKDDGTTNVVAPPRTPRRVPTLPSAAG